ncbi:DUF1616 domain-containing protein [Candidatus Bathyarchaeota archaeon]|nr:MAG: DUF1616 domain-containing protein [Candidatus Bathyarchaeota archaeon]
MTEDEVNVESFSGFLVTKGAAWFWGINLVTLFLFGVLFLFQTNHPIVSFARAIIGGGYVMFFPGFSVTRIIYPKRDIDEFHTLAYSIAISASLVPLIGIILNITPFGMGTNPVIGAMMILNTILSFTAVYMQFLTYRS